MHGVRHYFKKIHPTYPGTGKLRPAAYKRSVGISIELVQIIKANSLVYISFVINYTNMPSVWSRVVTI